MVKHMAKKVKNWWNTKEKSVYINEEGDEIIHYNTNGETVMGFFACMIGMLFLFGAAWLL